MTPPSLIGSRLPKRFWSKVRLCLITGCWRWTAAISGNGYGNYSIGTSRMRSAHRVAYEALIGAVPAGLELDHKRRVRDCCNPAHLEPVTRRTNILRGVGPTADNARMVECKAGHSIDRVDSRGFRYCGECRNARRRIPIERHRPPTSHQAAKTHCPRGHEYVGENLYLDKHGHRLCRACNREKQRERNRK